MRLESRLWLVRHAPVDGPSGTLHDVDAPADLADTALLGLARARLPVLGRAVCSPTRRTRETAAALGLNAMAMPDFREQSFGDWTGRRHDDIARDLGDAAYRAFWRASATNRPPGGESFTDQIARVRDGLAQLPAGDVVLVVHSGTVRAALAIALDLVPERALSFVIDPLSITRIDRLPRHWRVGCVNWR